MMEPSCIGDEFPHDARRRVMGAIWRDPLFWVSLAVVALTFVRWLNSGIARTYDAELAKWYVSSAPISILPGSVDGAGVREFVGAIAFLVVVQGCRHALGKAARFAFLFMASVFSGISALAVIGLFAFRLADVGVYVKCPLENPCYVGAVFGVYFLAGTAALIASFERKWRLVMPFAILSIGGNAAGAFLFSPSWTTAAFAGAEVLLLAYSFPYARKTLSHAGEFKFIVITGIALAFAAVVSMAALSEGDMAGKIAAFMTGEFFPKGYFAMRDELSRIALHVWKSNLWLGTGLGTFGIDMRFAPNVNWSVVQPFSVSALNGYWQLLAERGILGALMFAVPLCFLLWTYFRRLVAGMRSFSRMLPHPACIAGMLVLLAAAAEAVVESTFMEPGMFVAIAAFAAIAANSFPKESHDG